MSSMEEAYEDDFENEYDEDFESDDGEQVEVPVASRHEVQDEAEPAAKEVDVHAWPSLASAVQASPDGARKGWVQHANSGPLFSRSLFAQSPARLAVAHPTAASGQGNTWPPGSNSSSSSGSADPGVTIILQPPPPPLTDAQRNRASKALQRSMQRQRQVNLSLSTQLDLLVLQPMPLYQQFCQGVGVYAGRAAAAACQSRQLDQDVREQDVQTADVDMSAASCQVPDDLHCSQGSSFMHSAQQGSAAATASRQRQQPSETLLSDTDPALPSFLDWAVPQVLFELNQTAAAVASRNNKAAAAGGLRFPAAATQAGGGAGTTLARDSSSGSSGRTLFAGELQLQWPGVLSGRCVVGLSAPATAAAAATAATAISSAVAAGLGSSTSTSSHLLLTCCSPVAMPAAAALKAHGLAGLGCLCVWDLQEAVRAAVHGTPAAGSSGGGSSSATGSAASGGSSNSSSGGSSSGRGPAGLLQLLVSEGRPMCCCWGAGEASCIVFAGMEEGGICCWDLSEPDSMHPPALEPAGLQQQKQRQQQQHEEAGVLPARRPAYTTEVPPLLAPDSSSTADSNATNTLQVGAVSSVVAVEVLQLPSLGGLFRGPVAAAAAAGGGGGGGPVCQLVAATANGCVMLHTVMLGGPGSDAAVGDMGMRTGSRVWLVKLCDWLPLGLDLVRPPHMRSCAAASLMQPTQAAGPPPASHSHSKSSSSSSSSNRHSNVHVGVQLSCLVVQPGPSKQLLAGTDRGRVLKGACLGATTPPHEYLAQQWLPPGSLGGSSSSSSGPRGLQDTAAVQDNGSNGSSIGSSIGSSGSSTILGTVLALSVCPACPEAWLAGLSCGSLALFSSKRSRPVLLWHHPHGTPVSAVSWLPGQPSAFVALCGAAQVGSGGPTCGSNTYGSSPGSLLVFDLSVSTKQHVAEVPLLQQLAGVAPTAAAGAGVQQRDQHNNSAAASCGASQVGGEGASCCREGANAAAAVARPCCLGVLECCAGATVLQKPAMAGTSSSSSGSSGGITSSNGRAAAAGDARMCIVAVGYDDGSSHLWELAPAGWGSSGGAVTAEAQANVLQQLLLKCT